MQEILIAVNDNGDDAVQIYFQYDMSAEECKKVLEECLKIVETKIMEEDNDQMY